MNLTDEEIRIKVAEAMGYERRPCEWQNFIAWHDPSGKYLPPIEHVKHLDRQALHVPNYPEDLNAAHEMEETLSEEERPDYVNNLYIIALEHQRLTGKWRYSSLSARQRCLAYLKTKGLIP